MEIRITSLPIAELVAVGGRFRAPYLLQQANHTIELARLEGAPLSRLMADGLIDKVVKVRDAVAKAYEDKTVMAADAKLATGSQNTAMRSLKEWSRRSVARAHAAQHVGATIPDQLLQVLDSRAVPAMVAYAQRQLGLLGEHAATMDKVGAPTQPLIDEGRKLCEALIAADSGQELTRSTKLPTAIADFYASKGELYFALKLINDAGHELYAHDPTASARFNLSLLYRRHATGSSAAPEPTPAPPASSPPAATP
jgi:hypothetical protein